MKVLLISHTCISAVSGRPKPDIIAQQAGIDISVILPHRWKEYGAWKAADPVPSEKNQKSGARYQICKVAMPWTGPAQWYLHWYPKLARILEEERPDIIDLWEEPWGLVSAQTCWLRNRILPKTKIITETEQNVDKKLPPPFETFRSYTLANAAFAIGRNQEAIKHLRRKGFAGSAQVVPNGVDETLFRPLDRAECRRKFKNQGFTAGYVGRLVEEKGLWDFLHALEQTPNVHGVFVGEGPMKDLLLSQIADKALQDRVKIMNPLKLQELPELMNSLDVLVLPSRTTQRWKEQFGRVIIEAQACGIPVIGSDSGAIPDVIQKGGIVFPEGDIKAFGNALSRLAQDPELAANMGKIGREQVLAECTWSAVAKKMCDIYETVFGKGATNA